MRNVLSGLVFGSFLVIALFGYWSRQDATAQTRQPDRPSHVPKERIPPLDAGMRNDKMMAFSTTNAQGVQQVVVIDPEARVMAVYHIGPNNGSITLKSVRDIRWDLRMEEYNGTKPSPRDIRAMLPSR